MALSHTPSQTVGPYYEIGCIREAENELVPDGIRLVGQLLDGNDEAIGDGMIEVWDDADRRWGRCGTDKNGGFSFVVPKPAAANGSAPHLDVLVHARGLLKNQLTRVYFPDEAEANAADPVLSSLPEADRAGLVAEQEDGAMRFDIRLQGDRQTIFFAA
jgi:protocatechuate 3,4-dioxygenase alpha subunit